MRWITSGMAILAGFMGLTTVMVAEIVLVPYYYLPRSLTPILHTDRIIQCGIPWIRRYAGCHGRRGAEQAGRPTFTKKINSSD